MTNYLEEINKIRQENKYKYKDKTRIFTKQLDNSQLEILEDKDFINECIIVIQNILNNREINMKNNLSIIMDLQKIEKWNKLTLMKRLMIYLYIVKHKLKQKYNLNKKNKLVNIINDILVELEDSEKNSTNSK